MNLTNLVIQKLIKTLKKRRIKLRMSKKEEKKEIKQKKIEEFFSLQKSEIT